LQIFLAKYFVARTIIAHGFLRRNITADRNKLQLLHRAQSPGGSLVASRTQHIRELTRRRPITSSTTTTWTRPSDTKISGAILLINYYLQNLFR
jgi:hypothetical protein